MLRREIVGLHSSQLPPPGSMISDWQCTVKSWLSILSIVIVDLPPPNDQYRQSPLHTRRLSPFHLDFKMLVVDSPLPAPPAIDTKTALGKWSRFRKVKFFNSMISTTEIRWVSSRIPSCGSCSAVVAFCFIYVEWIHVGSSRTWCTRICIIHIISRIATWKIITRIIWPSLIGTCQIIRTIIIRTIVCVPILWCMDDSRILLNLHSIFAYYVQVIRCIRQTYSTAPNYTGGIFWRTKIDLNVIERSLKCYISLRHNDKAPVAKADKLKNLYSKTNSVMNDAD